jgi:3-(3-hydroxy-phenyl)propionate hydroxylase
MSLERRRVLIAGGGPVGLLCAWLLGRRGIPVRLFDENERPQADLRAATTHPATLELLQEDGLVEDMARVGLVAPIFQFWDRPTGKLVAQFDHALLKDDTRYPYVVQLLQGLGRWTARAVAHRVPDRDLRD